MFVNLPYVLALHQTIAGNRIRQLAQRQSRVEGDLRRYVFGKLDAVLFQATDGTETVIVSKSVPNLALLRHVIQEWARESVANGKQLNWIAVCSDDSVRDVDTPLLIQDLGFRAHTNANE